MGWSWLGNSGVDGVVIVGLVGGWVGYQVGRVGNSGVVYRGMNHTSANRGVAGTTGNILWGISSSSLLTHPKLLSKQGPAKGSSSVNRPTSHR